MTTPKEQPPLEVLRQWVDGWVSEPVDDEILQISFEAAFVDYRDENDTQPCLQGSDGNWVSSLDTREREEFLTVVEATLHTHKIEEDSAYRLEYESRLCLKAINEALNRGQDEMTLKIVSAILQAVENHLNEDF